MRQYQTPLIHWRIVHHNNDVSYGCVDGSPVNSTSQGRRVNCIRCIKRRIAIDRAARYRA